MENRYLFREAEKIDVKNVFQLILERMQWMDKKAITPVSYTHLDVYKRQVSLPFRSSHLITLINSSHNTMINARQIPIQANDDKG